MPVKAHKRQDRLLVQSPRVAGTVSGQLKLFRLKFNHHTRSKAGGSGNRIRVGSFYVTNAGDEADLVVAFNEQALLGRFESDNLKPNAIILLENKWREHADPEIKKLYRDTMEELKNTKLRIYEVPMERECLKIVDNAQRGKYVGFGHVVQRLLP